MSQLITKQEALKILRQRTGQKFTSGIFSKHFQRGRIWAVTNRVFIDDIEKFLKRREERRKVSPDDRLRQRLEHICRDVYLLDQRMVRLGKADPKVAEVLNKAAGWMYYGVYHLRQFMSTLSDGAISKPESPSPAQPEAR